MVETRSHDDEPTQKQVHPVMPHLVRMLPYLLAVGTLTLVHLALTHAGLPAPPRFSGVSMSGGVCSRTF